MRLRHLAVVVASAAALCACNNNTLPAAGSAPSIPDNGPASIDGADQQTIDGAKALAQAEIDRYGAGDAGGAWDLLDHTSQTTVSRADYIAVHDACPLRAPTYALKSARLETPTQAVVTIGYLGMALAYKVNYENGQWRWQMASSDLNGYAKGAAAKIAQMKKLGLCWPDGFAANTT
jgi:hypothetical protein